MTDEQIIAELRGLLEKVTAGEWHVHPQKDWEDCVFSGEDENIDNRICVADWGRDAPFIAAAKNHMPRLIEMAEGYIVLKDTLQKSSEIFDRIEQALSNGGGV